MFFAIHIPHETVQLVFLLARLAALPPLVEGFQSFVNSCSGRKAYFSQHLFRLGDVVLLNFALSYRWTCFSSVSPGRLERNLIR